MHSTKSTCLAVWVAAGLTWAAAEGAEAQTGDATPPGPPPSWDSLIPCAQKADPAEGFRCYQAAMRAAGYTPNPATVEADRRRTFGLNLPSLHLGGRERRAQEAPVPASGRAAAAGAPAEAPEAQTQEDRVTVTLEQVALTPPLNRLLMVTAEGAVWVQTDNETVAPLPRPGQTMTVVKGKIDGFFCQFERQRAKVRCRRTH